MKKSIITVLLSLVGVTSTLTANAQDTSDMPLKESPFNLSLELASRYIWRGQEYGDAPLGFATLSYANHGFGAWVMGAYTINNSHQEVDMGITYDIGCANIGISDYYYPSASGESDRYFDFNNHTTGHWGEAYFNVTPITNLRFTGSCYIYGADKKSDGKQAYSSYAEVCYTYQFKDDNALSLTAGASLNKGFYTGYSTGFSVVNIDLSYTTTLRFGDFRLPVKGSYIINPNREKSFVKFSAYFNI